MKQNDYLCPKCKGHLNVGGFVVLSIKNNRNKKGLMLLSAEIGNYSYIHHDEFTFKQDEMIDFFCPICQKDMKAPKNPDYAGVMMIDHQDVEYKVLFSRKAGDKKTFVLDNENVEMFGSGNADIKDMVIEDDLSDSYEEENF